MYEESIFNKIEIVNKKIIKKYLKFLPNVFINNIQVRYKF